MEEHHRYHFGALTSKKARANYDRIFGKKYGAKRIPKKRRSGRTKGRRR